MGWRIKKLEELVFDDGSTRSGNNYNNGRITDLFINGMMLKDFTGLPLTEQEAFQIINCDRYCTIPRLHSSYVWNREMIIYEPDLTTDPQYEIY